MLAIERAVASVGFDRFRDDYWDKQPLHLSAIARPQEIDSILHDISEFLDRSDIRYPALRLAKDGMEVPLSKYAKELRLGPHVSTDWIVNDQVFSLYAQGTTIILQTLQNSLPSFGVVANRLEQYFGASVHASCFITPPNSQGFTAHYDTYSFFAVQLFGSKEWSLYNSTERLPIRDDREDDQPWQPVSPQQVLTLHEGDFLYVPRGLYHSAIASSAPAVHLTLGIFTPNWLDVIKASIAEISASTPLRASLRAGVATSAESTTDLRAIRELLHSALNVESGVAAMKAQTFARHTDTRQGRLLDVLATEQVPFARYARHEMPYQKALSEDNVVLRFANKELLLPLFVDPIIESMCHLRSFTPSDLPEVLDSDSLQLLLRRLLLEGFIGRVSAGWRERESPVE